ncbi:MAG: putative Na+/H+ antiporter [Bdellovibrionales bacterium]|nr:putative Na+/H+ antiporter [Bdellovibrionales bacterium]
MGSTRTLELLSTFLFFLAIFHTFLVSKLEHIADRKPKGSMSAHLWHYLAEVEVVFGIWALVFIILFAFISGTDNAISYIDSLNYTEPAFVFVIMCIAATRPVILLASKIISFFANLLPFSEKMSFYLSALVIGPLLGSFITEPATMTVTALILLESFYKDQMSLKFKYATLGLLFVNVSVGGTLTHFAAPPVLMVASKWNWGTLYMLEHFGYKAVLAILISTALYAFYFKGELKGFIKKEKIKDTNLTPSWWMLLVHVIFLFLVVYTAHHPKIFIGIFCFFLGFVKITEKFQDTLKVKTSFLVAFFLAGLVTLGTMQAWWLQPLLAKMSDLVLFLGATSLTAITDNAALTYLGSLVELTDEAKYALVAGAVAGGGLTVIANAPNPAGFGILKDKFGADGINPIRLFLYALVPTIIAVLCLLLLPSFNY